MDQFEAAKKKHQRNLDRRLRYESPPAAPQVVEIVPVVQKEKPSNDAVIDVKVTLPTGEFVLQLAAKNVMQNVNPRLLNKNEFRNRLIEGLKPLLGETK